MIDDTSQSTLILSTNQPVLTVADARARLGEWNLKPQHRKNLGSALAGLTLCAGLPEDGIYLTCGNANAVLFRQPPSAFGFTASRFRQICSGIRTILRRIGQHAPPLPNAAGLSDAWKALHDAIPPAKPSSKTNYRRIRMISFIGYCSAGGIEPAAVHQGTLDAFEVHLATETICDGTKERARRVASNWNWARKHIPGWPAVELRRPGMRREFTFPLSHYPESFQADVELFLGRLADDDVCELFADEVISGERPLGPRSPLKPRTIERHRDQIRRAAAALVIEGIVEPGDLHSLRDLVDPFDRTKAIRTFYRARLGNGINGQVTHTLETLIMIGQWHWRLPDREITVLRGWAAKARPTWGTGMSEKNQVRLKALTQPEPRAKLQHFPEELLLRARDENLPPLAAARLAAYAIALEVLLAFPMRRGNLAGLRLDQHLQWLNTRRAPVSHIFLSPEETKNSVGMQWPLPAEAAARIELYLKHYRPTLASPGNQYLFPGPGLKGRSAHELAIGLCDLIHKELGVEINLHLMRHFAGWVYLNQHPGAYEVVRQILGHKSLRVVTAYYTGLEMDAAARHFDAVVLRDREASRHLARAAFGRGKPGRGRKV